MSIAMSLYELPLDYSFDFGSRDEVLGVRCMSSRVILQFWVWVNFIIEVRELL